MQSIELTDKNDFGDGCHMAEALGLSRSFMISACHSMHCQKRECSLSISIDQLDPDA